MSKWLHGLHDPGGEHLMADKPGWIVFTEEIGAKPTEVSGRNYRQWSDRGFTPIVRLNYSHSGGGTIPLPHEYELFAATCAAWVAKSEGATRFIIANEPNHEVERKNGVYITPSQYARCFAACRDAIKRTRPDAQVLPAPCAPYHANPIPWTDYLREMLTIIARNGGCDGIAVHAYTRSSNPDDIGDDVRMGPPLENTCAGFLTYQDALEEVPPSLRHLPAYITEFNELLPDGWDDRNTGVVQASYQHVNWWNTQAADANEQQFQCLVLYRWPRYDKWHIEGKSGVQDDFRAAVAKGYQSPNSAPPKTDEKLTSHLPSLSTVGETKAPPTKPEQSRDIDPRLTERGVTIETPPIAPGRQFWRVRSARWYNEQESQGRHHIYVEAEDDQGIGVVGSSFVVRWPSGSAKGSTNAHNGFNAGNFPMSKSLNEFSVSMDTSLPSETLGGIGMGADGNSGIHTSTGVVFQLATMPSAQQPAPTQPSQPTLAPAPSPLPILAHPVAEPQYRFVTQPFGARPEYYRQFSVDGVPLRGHNGIDFGTPVGSQIVAVDGGRVVEVANDPDGYGLYVKLVHPWGESLYAHLVSQYVGVGQVVTRGETIGVSGNTGNSTGPHLHFGLRVHPFNRRDGWGGYVDPATYLQNTSAPAASSQQPTAALLPMLKAVASEFGLEWQLLASLAWGESSWRPQLEGGGLLQIGDATWSDWAGRVGATNRDNARDNARVGAAYLAWLLRRYGDERKALWAWNWGPQRIDDGKTPPAITMEHASKVLHGRDLLRAVGA